MTNKDDFIIEEYSNKYKDQVKDIIGTTLADISVIDRKSLPIDDEDLDDIENIYSGRSKFWISLYHGKVIGTVAIRDLGNRVAKLNRMFVSVRHHGDGTGQRLLNRALDFAKKQGFTKIILNTHKLMRRAHRFYEKNGFVKTGKTGDKYNYEKNMARHIPKRGRKNCRNISRNRKTKSFSAELLLKKRLLENKPKIGV